jgi:hypothetical protein
VKTGKRVLPSSSQTQIFSAIARLPWLGTGERIGSFSLAADAAAKPFAQLIMLSQSTSGLDPAQTVCRTL